METKFKKITDLVPTTSFIFRFSSLTYSYDMFTFHKKKTGRLSNKFTTQN